LVVLDVSNPSQPSMIASIPESFLHIASSDSRIYITDNEFGLRVMDVSESAVPVEVGFHRTMGAFICAEDVTILNGDAYVETCDGIDVFRFTGLSIDGQVQQPNHLPVFGVTLSITPALTTTTDLAGNYTFKVMARGTYTIKPSLPGFTFWPASRSLTLPPNGVRQDFSILPLPASITLTPDLTSTLTLTDTQGLTIILFFPAGAVTETVNLTLTPTIGAEGGAWAFVGHAFELAASHEGVLLPDFTFNKPVTVTIHYSDDDIRLVNDESLLTLWEWAGNTWQDAAQVCESPVDDRRDEAGNMLSLGICSVGRFKLMGPTYPIFLPVVAVPQ
jgi:hypothetical protein